MRTLYYQPAGFREFKEPVTVGLRPGYTYRVELTGFAKHPGLSLYPTMEVRGTVGLASAETKPAYSVPVVLSSEDLDRILSGRLLTKVYYLEDPEQSAGIPTTPDQPLELEVRPGDDPLEEARARGRPVMIWRIGERSMSPEELIQESIAGTLLFPGDSMMAAPGVPSCLPAPCYQFFDPHLGPRPEVEEYLCDGGDTGARAGIGPDGKLYGLDPADTVAEYSDSAGRRKIAVSNRVCICAPRFGVLRSETAPIGYEAVQGARGMEMAHSQIAVRERYATLENRQIDELVAYKDRLRPSENEVSQGPFAVSQFEGLVVGVGQLKNATVLGIYPPRQPQPDRPLVITKCSDRQCARVGDVITFVLKYTNHGGQPITGIVISDSLAGRLEYVPGSSQTDQDAVFTTQLNEAGSLILRWEIGGSLPPGKSGLIRFQARVR
jgi:uncharacterized repeat protein (TIGR01451 family)